MIEHRNVVNFFLGMDQRVPHSPPGVWLAVTSLSFDISVLELLWTLSHGFKVVIFRGHDHVEAPIAPQATTQPMDFSLFYFSAGRGDRRVERHRQVSAAHRGGQVRGRTRIQRCLDTRAALPCLRRFVSQPGRDGRGGAAVLTKHVQIRAGSVVLPLHHPIRVAEAWSIVDNLSNGRVAIAFAAGWQPTDFVLMPAELQDRQGRDVPRH